MSWISIQKKKDKYLNDIFLLLRKKPKTSTHFPQSLTRRRFCGRRWSHVVSGPHMAAPAATADTRPEFDDTRHRPSSAIGGSVNNGQQENKVLISNNDSGNRSSGHQLRSHPPATPDVTLLRCLLASVSFHRELNTFCEIFNLFYAFMHRSVLVIWYNMYDF